MPEAWTDKDERQYEHIKESASEEGRSPKTAKRIAAATVNKRRSAEGRTKTKAGAKKSTAKKATAKKATAKKAAAGRKGGKATARKSGGAKKSR